jgi:hypothetical protein
MPPKHRRGKGWTHPPQNLALASDCRPYEQCGSLKGRLKTLKTQQPRCKSALGASADWPEGLPSFEKIGSIGRRDIAQLRKPMAPKLDE